MAKYYYFYVLYCNDDTLYAGYTTNLRRRFKEHSSRTGAKYTKVKSRQPLKLLYAERYNDKSSAMSKEALFKQLTRKKKEEYLRENGQEYVSSTAPFVLQIKG